METGFARTLAGRQFYHFDFILSIGKITKNKRQILLNLPIDIYISLNPSILSNSKYSVH